ncbi:unnamed protein product [Cuscuta epithymum]|uniref:Translocon-associated protein subunit beta n=2 Tax=Cuscuta epithymum TaxID=186058 RepID=A0AAV0GGQ8_9ASTE|nr:unnamed protein product [Cuscuta epithymum]
MSTTITQAPVMIVAGAFAALFIFAVASEAVSGAPFILAHKKVSLTKLSSGTERVSVTIDVYNQGSGTAYDVTLTDDSWDQGVFYFVTGNTSKSWEKFNAGSAVSHSFELESGKKMTYYGSPSRITYRVASKSKLQEAYSTPILPLEILSEKVGEAKLGLVSFFLLEMCLFSSSIWSPRSDS